ncbi:hypothetical protein GGR55DRAFT_631982 [Xylaria sp. FL0064]|nr:hypothetical protein GGR55DRAFT_631982 [Xylaria sp. FL0064]
MDLDADENTFFEDNSRKLLKQAAAYAIHHRTSYVAIFNWDFLVLIHFSQLQAGQSQQALRLQGCGDYCYITIIENKSTATDLRAALLGFLLLAYSNTP